MLTAFLTGVADAYFDYDVTKTLAYGFSFDTKTIGELLSGAVQTGTQIIDSILGLF